MGENGPRHMSWPVSVTHHLGLPLSGSPLEFLLPKILCRATKNLPHPFKKGRGSCGCDLASEGTKVVLGEPTSLKRREGLASGWLGVVGGEMRWRR